MERFGVVFCTALVMVVGTCAQDRITVTTKDGRISGVKTETVKGRDHYAFLSIPYAKPPLGPLRFKDPVPNDGWNGVRDGSVLPSTCSQVNWFNLVARNFIHEGSEDCLYLNLYTAKPGKTDAKLPVMVFIHGGGFVAGGSSYFNSQVLLDHDIVLVIIQYRLGVLGFLSTEDSVIPGNFGMKDQTMALRWIQNNVHNFGGDPNKVTLFGESAGGASVHFHYLSPYSEGLFSRGILQSGTMFAPWAMGAAFKEVAEYTGRKFGCEEMKGLSSGEASRTLLECLQKVDAEKLTLSIQDHVTWNYNPALIGPRVDGDYLPAEPEVLMLQARHKHADFLSGYNADEGALFTLPLYAFEYMQKALLENFDQYGPESLDLVRGDEDPIQLASKVYQHYVGGVRVDEEVADQLCELYGERHFILSHDWVSRLHSRNTQDSGSNTYLYVLSQQPETSFKDLWPTEVGKHWVSHVDELFLMFSGEIFGNLKKEEDLKYRDIVTQMWYNFAATGNPTPDDSLGFVWKPANPDNLQHLNITVNPKMIPYTRDEVREFWESLPTKQNKILNPDKVIHFHSGDNYKTKDNRLPQKPYKHIIHTEL